MNLNLSNPEGNMEREAGSARNSNKKLNHDRRRARQRAKRGMVLSVRREDGALDLTPHIASLNIITGGKYLRLGKGFLCRGKY